MVPQRRLAYSDIVFIVKKGPAKVGELRVSQGGIDWRAGKKKRRRRYSWENLDRLRLATAKRPIHGRGRRTEKQPRPRRRARR